LFITHYYSKKVICYTVKHYLIKNSPAVKKYAASKNAIVKKSEIQGGSQEMAVMVGK